MVVVIIVAVFVVVVVLVVTAVVVVVAWTFSSWLSSHSRPASTHPFLQLVAFPHFANLVSSFSIHTIGASSAVFSREAWNASSASLPLPLRGGGDARNARRRMEHSVVGTT